MSLPFAHETWFLEFQDHLTWSFVTETATLLLLTAAVLVTLGVRFASRWFDGIDIPWLGRLAPWMPFAIRIHLAVSLMGMLSMGVYLSPAMDLPTNFTGITLGIVMAIVAILMATGWQTKVAGLLLIAAGPLGMLEFGVAPVIQRIDLLGLALFIVIAGPGRWSADVETAQVRDRFSLDGRITGNDLQVMARGVLALRVAAGLALIIVAGYEKLLNPEYALHFLAENPELQVAAQLGLPMSDLEFIRLAGAIEVFFGLMLISGAMPQLVIVAAGIPFNATLWFFGTSELLGHLPLYGAMLLLLVFGSDPVLRKTTSAWGRVREPAHDGGVDDSPPATAPA